MVQHTFATLQALTDPIHIFKNLNPLSGRTRSSNCTPLNSGQGRKWHIGKGNKENFTESE